MKSTISKLFTVILMLFCFCGSAQTSLNGIVTNAVNGKNIMFATVSIFKNDVLILETKTDTDGNYFFPYIKPGIYDIHSRNLGYTIQKINGIRIIANKKNRVDFSITIKPSIDTSEIIAYKFPY